MWRKLKINDGENVSIQSLGNWKYSRFQHWYVTTPRQSCVCMCDEQCGLNTQLACERIYLEKLSIVGKSFALKWVSSAIKLIFLFSFAGRD